MNPPKPESLRGLPPAPAPVAVPGTSLHSDEIEVGGVRLRVEYRRHARALRYRLTLQRDGVARCTVPRRGSLTEARRFVAGCHGWLAARLRTEATRPARTREWRLGTPVWLRGQQFPLLRSPTEPLLLLGTDRFPEPPGNVADFRPHLEPGLRRLAAVELPPRVRELADAHGYSVRRVSIRNQRSRWGSCSAGKVISLNWRLIQTPVSVRDYIILHELAHTRQLNHSGRFWAEVARICPVYAEAEHWLKTRGEELL